WVMLASEETDQAPSRLSRLLAAGAKPLSVARAYTRVGSRILIGSDKELFSQMMQVGQSLLSMISDKDKRLDVARLMFDYSCIQEDYEASLDLLRTCYEGKKIDHILNKVQAHKALKEGRSDEAVKRFRDFMDLVRTWKTKQYDQLTGESVPVSAVLGLNARRIGDILLLDGKKKEAAKAYAEAKEYYAKALGSLEKAPRWKADVEKAIKDLEAK
ncbi:MAG: hypothetical protein KAH23_06560, partial [Kiritimatiellae bacterium]|nr:hypothetical protein [Kiritimatiellia bacterium]